MKKPRARLLVSGAGAAVALLFFVHAAFAHPAAAVSLGFQPNKAGYHRGDPITFVSRLRDAGTGAPIAGRCILIDLRTKRGTQVICRIVTNEAGEAFCPSKVPAGAGDDWACVRARWPGDDALEAASSIERRIPIEN